MPLIPLTGELNTAFRVGHFASFWHQSEYSRCHCWAACLVVKNYTHIHRDHRHRHIHVLIYIYIYISTHTYIYIYIYMYTYTHNVFIWHPSFLMTMSPVCGAGPSLHHEIKVPNCRRRQVHRNSLGAQFQ